jgi:DNA-binding CsgD family transcriptional regulator
MTASTVADIVASIYEAALAPERWDDVLAKITARTGAESAILFRAQPRGGSVAVSGLPSPPAVRKRFVDDAIKNPFIPMLGAAPPFQPHGDRILIPRRELERTEFFRDWVEPFGMSDGLMTALAPMGPQAVVLTLARNGRRPNPFGEQAVKRLKTLIPYLRRALRIQSELAARSFLPDVASTFLLDRISTPVVILSETHRLVWGNEASTDLFRDDACITLARDGSLDARTSQGRRALAGLLASAAENGGAVAKLERANSPALIILALPLDGSTLGAPAGAGAVTLLFLDGAARAPSPAAAERFRSLFDLTPAELAVALMVAEDRSLPQVAAALGIAPSTARTHVKSLFLKTETHSQAALSRLLVQLDLIKSS